jgi:hypothetical protein
MWIASFDIGKKNFAWYIEEIDLSKMEELSKVNSLPPILYNNNGTPKLETGKILKEVCLNGKTIMHSNNDLTKGCSAVSRKYLDPEIFHNMNDLLDKYGDMWDKCSYFVIEMQLKRNTMAIKLGQHCFSYFSFRYGRFKKIIEYPAYYKTQILGCQKIKGKKYKNGKYRWKTIDQRSRKKWSIVKATEILASRGEINNIENIKSKSKKDDLADTLTQLQAFKFMHFVTKEI